MRGATDALRDEPPDRSPAARRARWRFAVAFVAVLAIWLGLRVAYWNGYYVEDAPGYVTDAAYAALGDYHPRDYVTGLNVGTYLPVALPLRLFGKSEVALGLWPLFCSLLGLVSLAGAAALLFGRRLGLLAALLYATYPGDVFFSTVVMPDAIQAGWLALAMFLVVVAYTRSPTRSSWILAAAGAAMGFCQLVRANGLLFLPIGIFCVLAFSWEREREYVHAALRPLLIYLAGWALMLVLEGLAYWGAGSSFLHRFHVVDRHYGTMQSIAHWGLNTDPATIPFSIFPPLLWWRIGGWGILNQDQAYHAFIFCLALTGVLAGTAIVAFARTAVSRRAMTGFVAGAFWFAWPLLYHEFGSQSVTHYVPMHRLSRHLVVYAPGAVFATVAASFLIIQWVSTWRFAAARRILAASGIALLGVHLAYSREGERIAHTSFHRIKETYARIREHLPPDVRTIVADPGDLTFFDFWLNPLGIERVRLIPFANYSRCDELPASIVFTRSNPGWEGMAAPVIQDTVRRLPCLVQPPPAWTLLYDGYPEKIFVVGPSMR